MQHLSSEECSFTNTISLTFMLLGSFSLSASTGSRAESPICILMPCSVQLASPPSLGSVSIRRGRAERGPGSSQKIRHKPTGRPVAVQEGWQRRRSSSHPPSSHSPHRILLMSLQGPPKCLNPPRLKTGPQCPPEKRALGKQQQAPQVGSHVAPRQLHRTAATTSSGPGRLGQQGAFPRVQAAWVSSSLCPHPASALFSPFVRRQGRTKG